MESNSAQQLLWLIRHSQMQGFVAGVIFSSVSYAAAKTAKNYSFTMRKRTSAPVV